VCNCVTLLLGKQASRRQVVLDDVYRLPVREHRCQKTATVGPPGLQRPRAIPLLFIPPPHRHLPSDDNLCYLPRQCHPWLISVMTTNVAEKHQVKCFDYKRDSGSLWTKQRWWMIRRTTLPIEKEMSLTSNSAFLGISSPSGIPFNI
jgi:hypothetical protein